LNVNFNITLSLDETGPETKELNIKLFDYFYIPDDLDNYEEVLDTLEKLVLTK
jgi:hypothetical protein